MDQLVVPSVLRNNNCVVIHARRRRICRVLLGSSLIRKGQLSKTQRTNPIHVSTSSEAGIPATHLKTCPRITNPTRHRGLSMNDTYPLSVLVAIVQQHQHRSTTVVVTGITGLLVGVVLTACGGASETPVASKSVHPADSKDFGINTPVSMAEREELRSYVAKMLKANEIHVEENERCLEMGEKNGPRCLARVWATFLEAIDFEPPQVLKTGVSSQEELRDAVARLTVLHQRYANGDFSKALTTEMETAVEVYGHASRGWIEAMAKLGIDTREL